MIFTADAENDENDEGRRLKEDDAPARSHEGQGRISRDVITPVGAQVGSRAGYR